MADRKISDLTALTTPASGDFLPIVDISEAAAASKNKRITIEELMRGMPDGTAAAPGIAFETDPNTGIFSPGADQVAISTNGANRLHITSAGNVGIGTSAPGAQLQVAAPSTGRSYSSSVLDFSNIHLDGITANTVTSALTFSSDGGGGAAIAFSRGGSFQTEMSFWTCSTNVANSATQRMTIDATGNVGIGTTSPAAKLHVSGGDTTNVGFNGTTKGVRFDFDGTQASIFGVDNTFFASYQPLRIGGSITQFMYGGAEAARIDSSGRLLVGIIASPANQLELSTDSAGKPSTNTWTIVSDERIKEEIELADLDLCYAAVKSIPLKRFKWKDEVYTEEQVRDRRKLGWIAQDVEAVFPKAVGTYEFKYNQVFEETIIPAVEEELDGEGNVTIPAQPERIEKGELISEDVIEDCRDLNSDQLYAAMYGAIQKLMIKVEALETEITSLKAIG